MTHRGTAALRANTMDMHTLYLALRAGPVSFGTPGGLLRMSLVPAVGRQDYLLEAVVMTAAIVCSASAAREFAP
jgi:hypothetical protein